MNQETLSIDILRRMKMFNARETLSDSELFEVQQFLLRCQHRSISPGETLIQKDKQRNSMYLLVEGELSVHLNRSHPEPIAMLSAGESVGEISLFDEKPATAFVLAKTHCQVVKLTLKDLMTLGGINPGIMINLLYVMMQRLRYGNLKLTEEQKKKKKFEEQMLRDSLTGLYNRCWLDQELPNQMQLCRQHRRPFILSMIDVDRFKQFNDTQGHQAGDCALQAVAQTLAENLRGSDYVARYGGEEFTVFLPMATLAEAVTVLERLRISVAEKSITEQSGKPLPSVTISLGYACMQPSDSPSTLIERADRALYKAKQNGRNRAEYLEE